MYVFSDLHGNKELFDKIMVFFNEEEKQTGSTVKYYFLGDACDRMNDGYEIMKTMLTDKRCTYIKGNHEDMFFKAAEALHDSCQYDYFHLNEHSDEEWADYIHNLLYRDENINLYIANGGYPTLRDWAKDGMPRNILLQIAALPVFVELEDYVLMHAGCNDFEYEYKNIHSMIWDRNHFFDDWNVRGTILIHGHTPIIHMPAITRKGKKVYQPLIYANGTKINMDCGCFHYQCISIYNMDSKEFIHFKGEKCFEE